MKNLLEALSKKPREEYVTAPVEENAGVDWKAIEDFEGGRQEQAYVPKAGKSGVTVSSGFDVGQRKNLEGLPSEIQTKLSPVVGLKRGDAERKLASLGGIDLTPEESDIVAKFSQDETEKNLRDQWSKVSDAPFESLSPAQKTVLASVAYQYGNLSRTPRFAKFAGKGEWDKVVKELRNFKDKYPTRRTKEAEYLDTEIKKKK